MSRPPGALLDRGLERSCGLFQLSLLVENTADFEVRSSVVRPCDGCFVCCFQRFVETSLTVEERRIVYAGVEVGPAACIGRELFEESNRFAERRLGLVRLREAFIRLGDAQMDTPRETRRLLRFVQCG